MQTPEYIWQHILYIEQNSPEYSKSGGGEESRIQLEIATKNYKNQLEQAMQDWQTEVRLGTSRKAVRQRMWNIQREGCHALEEIMRMIIRTKERQCTKQSPNEPMDNGGLYWVDTMSALRETYRTIRALLMANSSYGKEISTHIENPTRAGGKTVNEWLINDTGKAMPW